MKKQRRLFRFSILLALLSIMCLVYHEKIITYFDTVNAPVDQDICKSIPKSIGFLFYF
jgi:hypothetical protein